MIQPAQAGGPGGARTKVIGASVVNLLSYWLSRVFIYSHFYFIFYRHCLLNALLLTHIDFNQIEVCYISALVRLCSLAIGPLQKSGNPIVWWPIIGERGERANLAGGIDNFSTLNNSLFDY